MVDISIYVMLISGVTLIFDMIMSLIRGEGIFPCIGKSNKTKLEMGVYVIIAFVIVFALCIISKS